MVQDNPPLFVQDGEYNARMDRNLIGAMLSPSGVGESLIPRPGVRPHFVNAAGQEVSLLVTISNGQAVVQPGSAFVVGPSEDGIGAVYLATNPNPGSTLIPAAIVGGAQKGLVGIRITDPGGMPVEGAAEGKWEFAYYSTEPTNQPRPVSGWLTLGEVTIPASGGGSPTVVDRRLFTTAHGGTLRVLARETLNGVPGMPLGAQAFATTEDRMYVRAKGGWEQPPALAFLNTGSNTPIKGHPGQLLWNSTTKVLSVYHGDTWIDVGKMSAAVRLGTATTWPTGPNEAHLDKALKLQITTANTYYTIGATAVKLYDAQGLDKPTEAQMQLQINCYSAKTVAYAYLRATVKIYKKEASGSLVEDPDNKFTMNIDVFTSTSVTYDENGRPEGYIPQYNLIDGNGITWPSGKAEQQVIWKPMANLSQGYVTVRPAFKCAKPGYFEIVDMRLQVVTT